MVKIKSPMIHSSDIVLSLMIPWSRIQEAHPQPPKHLPRNMEFQADGTLERIPTFRAVNRIDPCSDTVLDLPG
jgi:hypothetical protein